MVGAVFHEAPHSRQKPVKRLTSPAPPSPVTSHGQFSSDVRQNKIPSRLDPRWLLCPGQPWSQLLVSGLSAPLPLFPLLSYLLLRLRLLPLQCRLHLSLDGLLLRHPLLLLRPHLVL